MRITAGRLHGRELRLPPMPGVRPTPAKVRQALFNILGDISGWRLLDLFAGSGLMALEAVSRGAAQVISIERSRRVFRHLQQVRAAWQLDGCWRLHMGEVRAALPRFHGQTFDLVFADPPYDRGCAARIPAWLDAAGVGCRLLVIEESARARPQWPRNWEAQLPRRYGDTCLHLLRRRESP